MTLGGDVQIEFQNSAEDYQILCRDLVANCKRRNLPIWRQRCLPTWAFIIVLIVVSSWLPDRLGIEIDPDSALAVIVAFLIFLVINSRMYRADFVTAMAPRAGGSFTSKQSHTYSEEGVKVETPGSSVQSDWSAFLFVEEGFKHYYLHYDNMIAIMIPKSAFPSDEEAESWRENCEESIAKAQTSKPSPS